MFGSTRLCACIGMIVFGFDKLIYQKLMDVAMEIEKRGCLRSSSSLAWACLVPSGQQMRVFRVGLGGSAPSISV